MKALKSLLLVAVVALFVGTAVAAEQMTQKDPVVPSNESLTSPIKGKVGYTFMTDYVWRGINLTEQIGGHKGTGANVANYGLGIDFTDISPDLPGTLWVNFQQVYFNRFDDTEASLAQTDWAVDYTVFCPFLNGDWTLEYRHIAFNETGILRHTDADTQEVSAQFAWHDGDFVKAITGEDMGKKVLNPTIKYIQDYELAQGALVTAGVSHPFDLADADPMLTGLSLTPSANLTMDSGYYGGLDNSLPQLFDHNVSKSTNLAYAQYGLNLGANLSKMLDIKCGKLMANGGVSYAEAIQDYMHDTLYSYAGISFNW